MDVEDEVLLNAASESITTQMILNGVPLDGSWKETTFHKTPKVSITQHRLL